MQTEMLHVTSIMLVRKKISHLLGTESLGRYDENVSQTTCHETEDCMYKKKHVKSTKDVEEWNIVLESLESAVIGTACTRPVYGEKLLDLYIRELNKDEI